MKSSVLSLNILYLCKTSQKMTIQQDKLAMQVNRGLIVGSQDYENKNSILVVLWEGQGGFLTCERKLIDPQLHAQVLH